jgi:hypothetical protein
VPVTWAEGPLKALRRAGVATLAAEGLFGALCLGTTNVHAVRITSPWAGDPYDAVVSCAIVVLPLLALPTAVRLLAHRGTSPVPVAAARAVLAGCAAGLACMSVALVACTAALTAVPDGTPALENALLALSAGAGVVAAALTLRAREQWQRAFARLAHMPAAARPDLADELATLLASLLPGSALARVAAWLDRGLDAWRASPRRHPWPAVVVAAWVAGIALAEWHAVREGPWAGLQPALVFAGTVAVIVGSALAVGVVWLGLLRPASRAGDAPADRPERPALIH